MTAATKIPIITPVYADEAVEAKHAVRREMKGRGAGLSEFQHIRTPAVTSLQWRPAQSMFSSHPSAFPSDCVHNE